MTLEREQQESWVPMSTTTEAALYNDALRLSRRAMDGGQYAVAYHALAAAMHAAITLGDAVRLSEVVNVAEEQRTWIATHAPGHELSDESARARNSRSLWESLERESSTRISMFRQRQLMERLHGGTVTPDKDVSGD